MQIVLVDVDEGPFRYMKPVSVRKVTEQIRKINTHKSPRSVDIPARLLKCALLGMTDVFTRLLNMCISVQIFPEEWKLAVMVPIPKKGDTRELNNLRPISL